MVEADRLRIFWNSSLEAKTDKNDINDKKKIWAENKMKKINTQIEYKVSFSKYYVVEESKLTCNFNLAKAILFYLFKLKQWCF